MIAVAMDTSTASTMDHVVVTTSYPATNDEISAETYIWICSLPIIFVVGMCGNIFTILVMQRKRMRGTATSIYLTFMAVADTAVLVTGMIPEWLQQQFNIDLSETHQWVCKFERFLFYGTADAAIFVLVAFTCDRFIAVCFPLKKREFCTSKRAKLACLIVLLVTVIKNVHVFWTRGAIYNENGDVIKNCGKPEPYEDFENNVRPWLVLALASLGPFLIILVCNIMIVKELFFSMRMRAVASDNTKAFTQTTAMCLSTSFAFLILITPSIVLLIGKPSWTQEANKAYGIAKAVNNQLMFLNHSINFFLYCLTGKRFRDEFVAMFICSDDKGSGRKGDYTLSSTVQITTKSGSSLQQTTPKFIGLRKSRSRETPNGKMAENTEQNLNESDPLCNNKSNPGSNRSSPEVDA